MRNIRSVVPQIAVPALPLGAPAPGTNGMVKLPPPKSVPVGNEEPVAVPGINDRPIGFPVGVTVELPMMISGTSAEDRSGGGAVIVEDPLSVAVIVVRTSVNVVVRKGSLDVGFVVGARVVDIWANATPEYVIVVEVVRLETCTKAVFTAFTPPPEQVVKSRNEINRDCPARSRLTRPLPATERVSEYAEASAAVPASAGLNVNSASFERIDVLVVLVPLPTPTPTKAVAAVLMKISEYHTMAATSATIMHPPQPGAEVVGLSSAGAADARRAGGAVTENPTSVSELVVL
ncbi:MAG: hypothetical protein Q9222_003759 [Ikaeria aurantiellina]